MKTYKMNFNFILVIVFTFAHIVIAFNNNDLFERQSAPPKEPPKNTTKPEEPTESVRRIGFPKGSSLKVKWSFGPGAFRSVSRMTIGFLITHSVKLSFEKLYPDAFHKTRRIDDEQMVERIDPNFLDNRIDSLHRMGISDNLVATNTSQYHDDPEFQLISVKKIRKFDQYKARRDRIFIYGELEKLLNKIGFNGKECILRVICEIAQEPFENSLYGGLMNVLTSPSMGGVPEFSSERKEYYDYVNAEKYGKLPYGDCEEKFEECSVSLISTIVNLVENILM